MSARIELSGKRFGAWTVVSYAGVNKHNQPSWNCVCDCGTQRIVVGQTLRVGITKSCGCAKQRAISEKNTKHGHSSPGGESRTYRAWLSMRRRCSDKAGKDWKDYGAHGITVCERWTDFSAFLADMGICPDGLSLDRINTYGNYEPKNCRWADARTQSDNRVPRRFRDLHAKALEAICMVV